MSAGLATGTCETTVGSIRLTQGGRSDGPAIVYLHSAGGEAGDELAAPFLDALALGSEVWAPMFPGFGGSDGLDQIDDMEDAVYHCLDVLARCGLAGDRRPHLVGMSLGGWMAVEIAWRYPERVRSLTLLNAVGLYVPGHPMAELFGRRLDELAEMTFADQSHPVAAGMHALAGMTMANAGSVPFDVLRPFFASMASAAKLGWNPYFHNPKLPKRLGRVTAPTLVVAGRKDRLVPIEVAEAYTEAIAGARLVVMEQGSHMLTVELPAETAELVLAHVEAVEGRA